MLLSLLSSSRRIRTPLIVGSLILGLTRQSYCAVLAVPSLVSATSACTSATLTWSNSGTSSYFLMVLLNGSPVLIQSVTGTSYIVDGLQAGNYTVMIQAIAESPSDTSSAFSDPLPFAVSCGPVCNAPVITVAPPKPAVLCHDDDRMAPVVFSGSIVANCPVTGAQYTLIDSFGSPSQASVTVAADGSFAIDLSLAVNPPWRRYSFSVQAMTSAGKTTSSTVVLGIQKDCDDGGDGDRDDAHHHHHHHKN